MNWLFLAALVTALLIACVAYTAVVLYGASWLVPGVKVDDFSTAVTAAISYTIWRFVLAIPVAVLLAVSNHSLDVVAGAVMLFAIDMFALWKAERTAVQFDVSNIVSRGVLAAVMSVAGVGLSIAIG